MPTTRAHRPIWQLVAVAVTSALAFVGLVTVSAHADSAARQPRFGVTMTLSATRVTPGTPITATGRVRDPQAVGREILFMAWNGVHFAAIDEGVVAADRSYRLTGVVKDNTVVLVKLRKRYHIRRAGFSPREVVHVSSAVVSAPTQPCTTTATATATATETVTAYPYPAADRRADSSPACTPTATATATATATETVTCIPLQLEELREQARSAIDGPWCELDIS